VRGIPVVGLDSLRYYWTPRTPAGVAADVDRLLRYYLAHWNKQRALLVGYSQGADVMPFILNRLPEATRSKIALGAALGLGTHAAFEFHMTNWVQDDNSGTPILPEATKLGSPTFLCIYGADEKDSLCPQLDAHKVKVVGTKGGHHFGGNYDQLAGIILDAAAQPAGAP
jgi:type IV secretory pathway VirJ component